MATATPRSDSRPGKEHGGEDQQVAVYEGTASPAAETPAGQGGAGGALGLWPPEELEDKPGAWNVAQNQLNATYLSSAFIQSLAKTMLEKAKRFIYVTNSYKLDITDNILKIVE